jgi:hypothetical protein
MPSETRPKGLAVANRKQNKKLYARLRENGLRKKVARQLTELSSHVGGGKKPRKPMREAVDRLEATVQELRAHVGHGDRQAAARKGARTRAANSRRRSAAGRKAARSRSSR